jgi:small-conductance mechanosensitive channel
MMAAWLVLAWLAWRVFGPGVLSSREDRTRPQWRRRLVRLLAAGSALSVSVYAALGYELTAAAIARALTFTIAALAFLTVVHALALRWIAIGQKRAAVDARWPGARRSASSTTRPWRRPSAKARRSPRSARSRGDWSISW